jgi:NAD(P)-dependent dehydrogenase (short-subunit alcohol dehydrogenase family)
MIKASGGAVINMSSNVALMALPGRVCYTAAKGGIASLARTDRVKQLLAANKDIGKLASSHLLGLGRPIHVANVAVYLASDEAEITTGQVLSVDSGVTIY